MSDEGAWILLPIVHSVHEMSRPMHDAAEPPATQSTGYHLEYAYYYVYYEYEYEYPVNKSQIRTIHPIRRSAHRRIRRAACYVFSIGTGPLLHSAAKKKKNDEKKETRANHSPATCHPSD